MKQMMSSITLGIAIVLPIASLLSTEIDPNDPDAAARKERISEQGRKTWQKALTDDNALKEVIRMNYILNTESHLSRLLVENMRERAAKNTDEDEIPLKREIKVMESMVREGLIIREKGKTDEEHAQAYFDIDHCMLMLAAVPYYDIHPLLKECLQSNNEGFRYNMLRNYVEVKNVEAIPFLHELVKEANLTEQNRLSIYGELGNFIERFTRQQRGDDVEKINAFLKEVRQAEQSKMQEQPTPKNDTPKKDEIIITGDNGTNKFSPPAMTNATDETGQPSQQTLPIPPEKSSSNKIILLFSIITLLVVIGGVVTWKKP